MRGLAVENKIPIVSATQTTRSGYSNTDVGLEDTSESFGLPATADLMFAIISTEQMEALGQVMVKQLKNRYNDPTVNKKFVIGIDRAKMKLYDVDQSAQDELVDNGQEDDTPSFDMRQMENLKSEISRSLIMNRAQRRQQQREKAQQKGGTYNIDMEMIQPWSDVLMKIKLPDEVLDGMLILLMKFFKTQTERIGVIILQVR